MSAIRRQKIDKLIEHAKSIEPKLKEQIAKEMREEFENTPILKEIGEKFEIDKEKLKEQTKERLVSELKKYALNEYTPNRKTLAEYIEVMMLRLGYE